MFMSFGYSDTMSIVWLISSPSCVSYVLHAFSCVAPIFHAFFARFAGLRGCAPLFAYASVGDFGDFAERGSRFEHCRVCAVNVLGGARIRVHER